MLRRVIIVSLMSVSSLMVFGQKNNELGGVKSTIIDNDIVVPEEINRNFDELVVSWNKDYKHSPDCDNNYDTNISYIDSIYIARLYNLPTEMELVYNSVVRSYIDMYTGRQRRSIELFLGKSKYYFPIFEQALDKYGLPLELKYLPIIESALNPTIVSKAGATGLWQFMIGTGKMYNLEINSLVDERRDPLRSTDAAARFLRDLYNIYGDWNLVIAAYNCGPGNVNKAIKKAGGKTDYWEIYEFLPRETRGYVPAFIAATYAMNYYKEHNICPIEFDYHFSTDTIQIDKHMHLKQLSEVLDVSIDVLRDMNPQFKKDIVPGDFKAYNLVLPSTKASDFVVNKDTVYAYKATEFLSHRKVAEPNGFTSIIGGTRYKVKRADNLAGIAKKYGITTTQLRKWNNLASNRLRVGQSLVVALPPQTPKTTDPKPPQSNDSQNLAQNNTPPSGVSKPETNNPEDSPDNESAGSSLLSQYFNRVREQNTGVAATEEAVNGSDEEDEFSEIDHSRDLQSIQTIYHKVRIGETLPQIATKYKVKRQEIVSWNNLKSSIPKTGQRLVIHLPLPQNETVDNEQNSDVLNSQSLAVSNSEEKLVDPKPDETVQNNTSELREQSITIQPEVRSSRKIVVKSETEEKELPRQPEKSGPIIHVVRKGDTLGHIAARYGKKITAKDLMRANNLSDDKLSLGQKIKIPRN